MSEDKIKAAYDAALKVNPAAVAVEAARAYLLREAVKESAALAVGYLETCAPDEAKLSVAGAVVTAAAGRASDRVEAGVVRVLDKVVESAAVGSRMAASAVAVGVDRAEDAAVRAATRAAKEGEHAAMRVVGEVYERAWKVLLLATAWWFLGQGGLIILRALVSGPAGHLVVPSE